MPPRSLTGATFPSPVPEARRWLSETSLPPGLPLLNVSQAAPVAAPPQGLRQAMADALHDTATHVYAPDLGLPNLRAALAGRWTRLYGGQVLADQVAITSGANHAFAAAIAATCATGDDVILPTPWYFNHKMWLDMVGVTTVALPTGSDLLPNPDAARALITPRTRAIVLVTPNNPGGVEYPPAVIRAFFDLARDAGLKLIVDETYRDFLSAPGAPHDLLTASDWDHTLIQLYSFSKAYRMTGHRVGALIGAPALLPEVEKFIDTVTICATPLGQRAALWAMAHLDQWLAGEADDIATRRAAIQAGFTSLEPLGWRLRGLGAYFAYVQHPYDAPADIVARALLAQAGILALPGTMFVPGTDPSGARHLRFACANIDAGQIADLFARLAKLPATLAPGGGAA